MENEVNTKTGFDRQDRDLLIRLNTRVEDLIISLEKKDHILAQDIGGLKEGKVDKTEFSIHCTGDSKDFSTIQEQFKSVWTKTDVNTADIKVIYRYLFIGVGAIAAIQFIAPYLLKRIFNY